jgi:glycosyltransferase involved in cell wall biosynthesis
MKFSVLMSIYAKENPLYFNQSMESIWEDQTTKPSEIVLVKDGKLTKALDEVVSQWRKIIGEKLKVVSLQRNVGLGAALNEGFKHCSNDLIARMDSDDICLPERFSLQVVHFDKNPEVDILGGYAVEIDSDENLLGLRKMPSRHDEIVSTLWANPIIHPTVMFRKSRVLKVGAYDESLRRRQDYDLWFRCAKFGLRFGNISIPVLLYRFDGGTHKKQTIGLAFEQAKIGFKGASLIQLNWWKRLACFIPFFRSLLPNRLQHWMYNRLRRIDPRKGWGS